MINPQTLKINDIIYIQKSSSYCIVEKQKYKIIGVNIYGITILNSLGGECCNAHLEMYNIIDPKYIGIYILHFSFIYAKDFHIEISLFEKCKKCEMFLC